MAERIAVDKRAGMIDITGVELVAVVVSADGKKVWVNVDGLCRLRVQGAKTINIADDRTKPPKKEKP